MKNYELLYILPANLTSKEIADNFKEIKENIEKLGAKMLVTLVNHPFLVKAEASKEEEAEELKGLTIVKRKLAYPIKKNKFGFFCLINFSVNGKDLQKIDKYLALNGNVLRSLIVQDNPMTQDELSELHKLFARKRAEQEKEEREIKEAKEEKKEVKIEKEPIKEVFAKKVEVEAEKKISAETISVETKKKETEMEKVTKETEKAEKKETAETKKTKKETPEEKVKETKDEETATEPKDDKKKEDKRRKKKIKLEDLEDKLDEILEDTMT